MKNKILGIIALIAITGFSFTACGESEPDPKEVFYGTWKSEFNTYIISANKVETSVLELDTGDSHSYTLSNVTWAKATNNGSKAATYPEGYKISGTITSGTGMYVSNIGDAGNLTFYIAADKKSVIVNFLPDDICVKK